MKKQLLNSILDETKGEKVSRDVQEVSIIPCNSFSARHTSPCPVLVWTKLTFVAAQTWFSQERFPCVQV